MIKKSFAALVLAAFIAVLSTCTDPVSYLFDKESIIDVTKVNSAASGNRGAGWYYTSSKEYYIYDNGVYKVIGNTGTGGATNQNRVTVAADLTNVSITLLGVTIETPNGPGLDINGATVTVLLSGTSTLKSTGSGFAGIHVGPNSNLTISSASGYGSTNGSLTVWGDMYAAGIGGNQAEDGGTITIKGGTIEAVGSVDASIYPTLWGHSSGTDGCGAGIGGGGGIYSSSTKAGDGGNITISGGKVTAKVGCNGSILPAGIGGGSLDSNTNLGGGAGNIVISGGDVTAESPGAGIGNGEYCGSPGGSVTITGGTIKASSVNKSQSAAIGSGLNAATVSVTISGGAVYAYVDSASGNHPATIGGGEGSDADVVIEGGTIVAVNSNASDMAIGAGAGRSGTVKISGGTIIAHGSIGGAGVTVNLANNPPILAKSPGNYSVISVDGQYGIVESVTFPTLGAGVNKAETGTVTLPSPSNLLVYSGATFTVPPGWTVDLNGNPLNIAGALVYGALSGTASIGVAYPDNIIGNGTKTQVPGYGTITD
jgi:hypothetical protein